MKIVSNTTPTEVDSCYQLVGRVNITSQLTNKVDISVWVQ